MAPTGKGEARRERERGGGKFDGKSEESLDQPRERERVETYETAFCSALTTLHSKRRNAPTLRCSRLSLN